MLEHVLNLRSVGIFVVVTLARAGLAHLRRVSPAVRIDEIYLVCHSCEPPIYISLRNAAMSNAFFAPEFFALIEIRDAPDVVGSICEKVGRNPLFALCGGLCLDCKSFAFGKLEDTGDLLDGIALCEHGPGHFETFFVSLLAFFCGTFRKALGAALGTAFRKTDFVFSLQVRHVFRLAVEKFLYKVNQFHGIEQVPERFVLHNLFGNGFLLDNYLDGAEPLRRLGVVVCGDACLFELEELVDFHENLLDLGEELPSVAHFVNVMNVLLRFFGEELEIQEPEEVDARQLVLLAGMHLVLDDARDVVFHAIAEEVVTLLLDFDQHLFAGIGRADDVQNAVLLVEYSRKFLHFEGDFLDGVVALQAKHRVHERDEKRVVLFLGEDNLENAVAKNIGVFVELLVLEEVALVDFHCLEQGVMLRAVHIFSVC